MGGEKRRIMVLLNVALAAGLLLAAGCGGTSQVVAKGKVSEGEKAVNEAKTSNASLNAPVELVAAEGKLSAAKEMFLREEYDAAARLADEASVDAEYARAKATTEKNRKAAEEMRENIEVLRKEIQRKSR
jgi:hypothetical protein